jgi:hypothetical protein
MSRLSPIASDAVDGLTSITSDDGSLAFLVRRDGRGAYLERIQHLSAIGRLSHSMRFDDLEAFLRAYEADELRFIYPLIYWRLRQVMEEVFGQ